MRRRELIHMMVTGVAVRPALAAVGLQAGGFRAAVLQERSAGPLPPPLIALFPLKVVLLPDNNLPLHIFEPRYQEMIQECIEGGQEFGVLRVNADSISPVGCTARITDVIHRYRDGRLDILTKGERRFRIGVPGVTEPASLTESDLNSDRAFFRGAAAFIDDDPSAGETSEGNELVIAHALELRGKLMGLIAADDPKSTLPQQKLPTATHPRLSFQLMDGLPADADWKQELLELRVERERLVRVVLHLQQLIEFMQSDPDKPATRRVA
jgi:Lon protease-like protein